MVQDVPGVGENLNDHFGIDIVAELTGHYSLDRYNRWRWAAWVGLQYLLFRSGPGTSNVVEGGAFWLADKSRAVPDPQLHFLAGAEAGVPSVPPGTSGITLNSYTLRPQSRGTVRLRSRAPAAAPIVDPNFLAEPEDLKTSVEGVKSSREIFGQPSLRKHIAAVRHHAICAAPQAPRGRPGAVPIRCPHPAHVDVRSLTMALAAHRLRFFTSIRLCEHP